MTADQPTRILFVTWDGPQVNYLESLFLPIFVGLAQHGVRFDVLQFRWGSREQEQAIRARCEAAGVGYRSVRVMRRGGAAGAFATALLGGRQVRKAVTAFGNDAVMPRSVLPALATLASRIAATHPILFDADGLEIDERAEFSGMSSAGAPYRILRDIEAQIVRKSTTIITRTAATREILVARAGPPVTPKQFHLVANGRDPQVFHPFDLESRARVRAELGIAADAPLVVYVGSVGARYRTRAVGELALEVRGRRPDTHLLVLTGSPDIAETELLAPLPELRAFTTLKRVPPDQVARYLASADVGTAFIRPSFSTQGILPVKVGEYLLCGVPVVGTGSVGDNAHAIRQGVYHDDASGHAAAADWIVDQVLPEREAYRHRARQVGLDTFSLDRSVADYRTAIQALQQISAARNPGNALPDTR